MNACPQPWPVVVVEHKAGTCGACFTQGGEQPLAPGIGQHREADATEIEHLITSQRRQQGLGVGAVETFACRRLAPPVQKAPLAIGVGLDQVEARQAPGQHPHPLVTHALLAPTGAHGLAQGVVAHRGQVIHLHLAILQQAPQVDGRIERIAAKGLGQLPIRLGTQLDHALADEADAGQRGRNEGQRHADSFGYSGTRTRQAEIARPGTPGSRWKVRPARGWARRARSSSPTQAVVTSNCSRRSP